MPRKQYQKAGGGRHRLVPTKADVKHIEAQSSKGAGHVLIARSLGISRRRFVEWRKEFPEVEAALEVGREIDEAVFADKLREKALNGDITALIFLLKAKFGWKEGEAKGAVAPNVVINLPASMPMQQFLEAQTVDATQSVPAAPALTTRRG